MQTGAQAIPRSPFHTRQRTDLPRRDDIRSQRRVRRVVRGACCGGAGREIGRSHHSRFRCSIECVPRRRRANTPHSGPQRRGADYRPNHRGSVSGFLCYISFHVPLTPTVLGHDGQVSHLRRTSHNERFP